MGVEGDVLKCSQASIIYLSFKHPPPPPHRAESQPKRLLYSFVSTLSSTPARSLIALIHSVWTSCVICVLLPPTLGQGLTLPRYACPPSAQVRLLPRNGTVPGTPFVPCLSSPFLPELAPFGPRFLSSLDTSSYHLSPADKVVRSSSSRPPGKARAGGSQERNHSWPF